MRNRYVVLFLVTLFFQINLEAHPVSFQGATSLMSYNKEKENEWMLTYSFRPNAAVALNQFKFEDFEVHLARLNFLAQRWNNEDSQGNIYLSLGQGLETSRNESRDVTLGSYEMDWESRKYYTSFQYNKFFRQDSGSYRRADFEMFKARLGMAPYVGEFSDIHTWLILQFDKTSTTSVETTQVVRVFYKNVLMEFGARYGGGWIFNYMVHF